jgi:hypothetical protein
LNHEGHEGHEGFQQDVGVSVFIPAVITISADLALTSLSFFVVLRVLRGETSKPYHRATLFRQIT